MIGDIPPDKVRSPGDPTPEEIKRITDDILSDYAKRNAQMLSDTERAITKAKTIYRELLVAVRGEVGDHIVDRRLWRERLMNAFRYNFEHHLSREELIEVLSVMHTELVLERL